jgi:hypothetical protein
VARHAQATASGLCAGIKLDSNSTSISDDDGERKWKVALSGPGCKVDMRAEGKIEFNRDFTDISRISNNGFVRIDITERGVRRQLDIESNGGTLSRRWQVDGREQPYDEAAARWFGAFLIELDRRTAVGIDVRLPLLLQQGGVDAVLRETELIPSDYVRSAYFTGLGKRAKLTPAEVTRVLRQAASLTESDYYAHELINAFAGHGISDPDQRAAVVQIIKGMDSDYYRAESVDALVGAGRPGAAELDFLVSMLRDMESDHYKLQVLNNAIRGGALTPAQRASLVTAGAAIESDYYAAEFLKGIAAEGRMDGAIRETYVKAIGRIDSDYYVAEVVKTLIEKQGGGAGDARSILAIVPSIESDHYRTETLAALLQVSGLTESDLLGIVSASAGMSDHYATETLTRVLRYSGRSDRVRDAAVAAGDRLSDHYAGEVRRAAGR